MENKKKSYEKRKTGSGESSCSGIGRYKSAVARATLVPGIGTFQINKRSGVRYLQGNTLHIITALSPLMDLGVRYYYDIIVNTHGGGIDGQVGAIRLAVARAVASKLSEHRLSKLFRRFFKSHLTRDARCKERKKYGLRKARKAPQFSKR